MWVRIPPSAPRRGPWPCCRVLQDGFRHGFHHVKLANLNDQDRATIEALVRVGWDEVDAAEALRIPPATLRSRLHRARSRAGCKTTADLAFAYGLERAA